MKRLLLPLIAALALPTAAYAENYTLVLIFTSLPGKYIGTLQAIPTTFKTRTKCMAEGKLFADRHEYFQHHCIEH